MIYQNDLSAYHGMEVTDIGHGVLITPVHAEGKHRGRPHGYIEIHKTPAGEECAGAVAVRYSDEPIPDEVTWEVRQEDPLTLAPSIRCLICGHHGWIENGTWVPA